MGNKMDQVDSRTNSLRANTGLCPRSYKALFATASFRWGPLWRNVEFPPFPHSPIPLFPRSVLLLLLILISLVAPLSTHGQARDGELPTTKTTPRLEEL